MRNSETMTFDYKVEIDGEDGEQYSRTFTITIENIPEGDGELIGEIFYDFFDEPFEQYLQERYSEATQEEFEAFHDDGIIDTSQLN